jgi:hypothetical protein
LRHFGTASRKAREHVLKLRQLNLELSFAGPRVTGKDVEDQLGTIHHAAVKFALKIAKLGRR